MSLSRTRVGIVMLGNRLVAAALRGARLDAFVVEAEHPAAALRAELDSRKIDARAAALGLARATVTVKPIELPAVTGTVADMVRFELERHLPFRAEDASFDLVPLPADADAAAAAVGARRVLVAAADRRLVDATLRVAEEAHLRPLSLTVAAHELPVLARPDRRRIVWVHRSGDVTELLFLANGGLLLSRSLPTAEDAAVAEEIQLSLGVVRWPACDAIWVSGDRAAAGAPDAAPLTGLGAPVTEPPYTAAAREWLGSLEGEGRGAMELALAVAAGRGTRPLDLLPESLRPRRLTRPQLVTLGSAAVAVVLAIAALLVPGYRDARRLRTVNAEIVRLEPQVRSVEAILRELEGQRRLLTAVDAVRGTGMRPLPALRELTELLPSDTWLTTVSLDAKGIELTGQAASASGLIPLLENSPRFERVEFASPVTRGRDKEQFRIRAAWESGGARLGPTPTSLPPGAGTGVPARPTIVPVPPAGAPRATVPPAAPMPPAYPPGAAPPGAPMPPGSPPSAGMPGVSPAPVTPFVGGPAQQPRRPVVPNRNATEVPR